jgi:hypothetical protein
VTPRAIPLASVLLLLVACKKEGPTDLPICLSEVAGDEAVEASSGQLPPEIWFQVLLKSYNRKTGIAPAPVKDCSGKLVEPALPPETAACIAGPNAGAPLPERPLVPDDLVIVPTDDGRSLVWVKAKHFDDGDALGPIAIAEWTKRGIAVRSIGAMRAHANRAKLRLEPMGSGKVLVIESDECAKDNPKQCERIMRLVPMIGDRFDERAVLLMRALYMPFMRNHDRMQLMDVRSAEFTKYAANAMLATRISFMNELALLAERVGADIEQVRRGIGSDPRIGTHFLYPGTGYGGSCFPKDVKALVKTGSDHGVSLGVLKAVESANDRQKRVLVDKVVARFGEDLAGRTFALWGLAFKPNTDDMRDAPSRVIAAELVRRGATLRCYDPVAMTEAARVLKELPRVNFVDSAADALAGADALLVVTEWKEFRNPDFDAIKAALKQPVVFDGRNLYDPAYMKLAGIEYAGIGRGAA